jgi:hypothetical protein
MRTGLTRRASKCLVEALEDPLLLFSVLYGFLAANLAGFNREVVRELAPEFLALAEKQGNTGLISEAHRLMGHVFFFTGEFAIVRWLPVLAKITGYPPYVFARRHCGCSAIPMRLSRTWTTQSQTRAISISFLSIPFSNYAITDVHLLREIQCSERIA